MAQRKTLTEAQVDLLRWIDEGCPIGVYTDDSHRISAAALRRRGLLAVSGRGPSWEASLTEDGRRCLERVESSEPPLPRQANVSVTQQLVDDVIAAGGALRVPARRWGDPHGVDYERRANLAEVHGKVPAGKRLSVSAISPQELQIELVDGPARPSDEGPPEPIEVPERIARYHPAARAFRDRKQCHEVSEELLPRATRIIHVLATEAEKRGWQVSAPEGSKDAYGRLSWTATKDGHLAFDAEDERFWFRLREGKVHTRGPWEAEVKRYRNVDPQSSWYRDRELPSGRHDANGTGQLELELHCSRYWMLGGRRARWGDRKRWRLEDRLADVLREIEDRLVELARIDEERRVAEEERKREELEAARRRETEWASLIEEAKARWADSRRTAELRRQAEAWQEARLVRQYCAALEQAHGESPESAAWLRWAREFALRRDPLQSPPAMPALAAPAPEEIQEFMPLGWSAHGPEQRDPRSGPAQSCRVRALATEISPNYRRLTNTGRSFSS